MFKPCFFLVFLIFFSVPKISSQCLIAPSPPACNGSEPALIDNETLNTGTTKWYYGSTVTMNSLTLNGGTLVVCGDLTIDKFYMDKGTIFIRPGARFVISSGIGAGLILRGDSYVYNYGIFEVQRNLSLENGYATASTPNVIINATPSSIFKMSNQYFVVNNPFSWFVNNGTAEFWGIITDPQASGNSVCLGNSSITKMAVLINKVKNSYITPVGNACVYVHQFSQFYNQLSNSHSLFVCLGTSHNSDSGCIPFGCQPNNWGAAQAFTNCAGCSALGVLAVQFISFTATESPDNRISLDWQLSGAKQNYFFKVEKSVDGIHYTPIDSFIVKKEEVNQKFNSIDKTPLPGTNYYMIKYTDPATGKTVNSKTEEILFEKNAAGFVIYPIPFDDKFLITYNQGMFPEKIILTDITGRNIRISYSTKENARKIELLVIDKIEPGIYIIHMQTSKKHIAQTILKK
jgi:hypothetical protein